MKKILLLAALSAFLFACNQSSTTANDKKDSTVMSSDSSSSKIDFPYKAMYSSDFEIGDPKYAQTVLKLWKDYDNNTLNDNSAFADSVSMDFPEGKSFYGTKDSFIHSISAYRNSLQSATDDVEVFVVLKSKDKGDTWVCVWGREADVLKNGKKDTTYLNENWMFNKDGKISYISQFAAKSKM